MMDFDSFKSILKSRKIDYDVLYKNKNVEKIFTNFPRDINVVIPLRGRLHFLENCIKYLRRAANRSSLNVSIVVVENSDYSELPWLCYKEVIALIDYIFIPNLLADSLDHFNKSLCFNMGIKYSLEAPWYLFHDVDILVDEDFFVKLEKYIEKNPPFLQPYSHQRIYTLGYKASKEIIHNHNCINLEGITEKALSRRGLSGGSVLVRRDIVGKVGGYDPELFFGYAPEDNFFWTKLECAVNEDLGSICDHHIGGGMYADNPEINVYHLFHSPVHTLNSEISNMMNSIHYFFLNTDAKTKQKILNKKRDLLR